MSWYRPSNAAPIIQSILAILIIIFATVKLLSLRKTLKHLRLGKEGEMAVGQYLDKLRAEGYQVLHDIVGDKFNIDHVIIGPAGIFAIETKTLSKKTKGNPTIKYDGDNILVDGHSPDRDPIVQIKAASRWLQELLKESTGRDFSVKAVILYPGWYIEQTGKNKNSNLWVLNPKGLPAFLNHSNVGISPEDIHLVTYHLCRHVRTSQKV